MSRTEALPGSTVPCELTRYSPSPFSMVRSRKLAFRRGARNLRCSWLLQLASSASAPRARQCVQKWVLDQFTVAASCGVTKSAVPSLHELSRYTCKAEATPQFHRLHTFCHCQRSFVGHSYWPRLAAVEQNREHHCLIDPDLCCNGISRRDQRQDCWHENVERARLILLL